MRHRPGTAPGPADDHPSTLRTLPITKVKVRTRAKSITGFSLSKPVPGFKTGYRFSGSRLTSLIWPIPVPMQPGAGVGSPILLNQSNSLFSGLFDMRNVADHSWVTKNINKMLCWLKSRVWDGVRICIWIWPGLNTWNWKWTLIRNWILSSTPHLDSNFDLNLDPVTDVITS